MTKADLEKKYNLLYDNIIRLRKYEPYTTDGFNIHLHENKKNREVKKADLVIKYSDLENILKRF